MSESSIFHHRLLVEEFSKIRGADELRRYAASQRRGRVDANPHQIDAVAYALQRIPEGGCILADEVGLGKTIEAGLLIAQLMAEGARRVLLIVPKALMGQWQTELYTLFGFDVKIGEMNPEAFVGDGIFVVNREFAGGARGAPLLRSTDPFDLAVIDEAHELFAGIYKRFDRSGEYIEESRYAQTAHRVLGLLKERRTPVLLLTATPMQNTLAEIWGLVQYIEPNDRLLGKLSTFREVFIRESQEEDGLSEDLAFDLRKRLANVVQRTLRRQAQEFLAIPFVERQAKTIEYTLTADERSLYDDVTAWLMAPDLLSYKASARRLLVIGFHRRMASSFAALRSSLENVAARLRRELEFSDQGIWQETIQEFASDLEESTEDLDPVSADEDRVQLDEEPVQPREPQTIEEELDLVQSFIQRAKELEYDSKADCLLSTLKIIEERAERGDGTGKVVIFTESIKTQEFLLRLLVSNGFEPEEVTLFRGNNNHERARQAVANWQAEVAVNLPPSQIPTPDVAVRLALVHEFKTRSRVLIATEAGAKGLNLQFCESLVNYDLPWNPQRIEQRIGRVHRYGQQRGVIVFNLLDLGNEASKLTYEILSRKLDLFGKVLDASDDVLHTPDHHFPQSLVSDVGVDFERQVRQIYQQSTSIEDVVSQLKNIREKVDGQRDNFDKTQLRCAQVIESRLDDTVAQVFRSHQDNLPACLAEIDNEMDQIFRGYLHSMEVTYSRNTENELIRYQIEASARLPTPYQNGCELFLGDIKNIEDGECLYQGHPLLEAAFKEARTASPGIRSIKMAVGEDHMLTEYSGTRGRLRVSKLRYRGLVIIDRLVVTMMTEDSLDPIENVSTQHLLAARVLSVNDIQAQLDNMLFEDCVEESVLDDQHEINVEEDRIFESRLQQLELYMEDRIRILQQKQSAEYRALDDLEQRRASASSPTAFSTLNESIKKSRRELSRMESEISVLRNGTERNYQSWRESLLEKRSQRPDTEVIIDLHFELVQENQAC